MPADHNKNKTIYYIAALAVLLRIAASYFIADLQNPEMWEFGIIARNLLNGEGFTFEALTKNVPSAFMPPGLPYLYYLIFLLFGDNSFGYFVILLLNALVAGFTVILIYRLSLKYFNNKIAFTASLLTAIFPVYIYSSISFNSIVIYQFLLILLLLQFDRFYSNRKLTPGTAQKIPVYYAVLTGITSGIFLYFRAEAVIFILFITVYLATNKFIKHSIIFLFICIMMILPWNIRNYNTFGKFIPVSTSFGYNFYTGHGDDASTEVYKERLSLVPEDKNFEIRKSEIALETAFLYIKNNPINEIKESIKKVFSLWVIDIYRETSKNPVYLFSWLPVLLFFIAGTFKIYRNRGKYWRLNPVYFYLLFSTVLVIMFFNIPRYQIQMSISLIPISVFGFLYITNKLNITE